MKEYNFFVSSLAKDNADRVFLNSDEEHALIVLVNLFRQAKETVRIFAACLCEHIGNKPEYIVAISEFIERGGKVRMLLNKFDENLVSNSNLFKRLAYYAYEGADIQIKRTLAHPFLSKDPQRKEVHFTVIDETGYRIETDIEKRTAECNFNNPTLSKGLVSFFDRIFNANESVSIDLNALFNGTK